MKRLVRRYRAFVSPQGPRHRDEEFGFAAVFTATTFLFFRTLGDGFELFFPHMPYGGFIDVFLYFAVPSLAGLSVALIALWSYRHLKRFAHMRQSRTTVHK